MAPKITPRRSEDRGHTDLGWLDARYTFSFDTYRDHNFAGFGALQVLNEDIIKPGKGFGKVRFDLLHFGALTSLLTVLMCTDVRNSAF